MLESENPIVLTRAELKPNTTKPMGVTADVLSDVVITTTDGHSGDVYFVELDKTCSYSGYSTSYQITFTISTVNVKNIAASGSTDIEVEITEH